MNGCTFGPTVRNYGVFTSDNIGISRNLIIEVDAPEVKKIGFLLHLKPKVIDQKIEVFWVQPAKTGSKLNRFQSKQKKVLFFHQFLELKKRMTIYYFTCYIYWRSK